MPNVSGIRTIDQKRTDRSLCCRRNQHALTRGSHRSRVSALQGAEVFLQLNSRRSCTNCVILLSIMRIIFRWILKEGEEWRSKPLFLESADP